MSIIWALHGPSNVACSTDPVVWLTQAHAGACLQPDVSHGKTVHITDIISIAAKYCPLRTWGSASACGLTSGVTTDMECTNSQRVPGACRFRLHLVER